MTENVEELVEILEQTEIDTNSIRYVRKMKGISTTNKENNPSSGWGGRLGGLANAVSQVILDSRDMNRHPNYNGISSYHFRQLGERNHFAQPHEL